MWPFQSALAIKKKKQHNLIKGSEYEVNAGGMLASFHLKSETKSQFFSGWYLLDVHDFCIWRCSFVFVRNDEKFEAFASTPAFPRN